MKVRKMESQTECYVAMVSAFEAPLEVSSNKHIHKIIIIVEL